MREQLPFPESSFDLVVCQFALMFVTNKAVALAEMRRVVTEDGRVLISVWQSLDRHPFYQTLHKIIQQRLGMSALQDIFALGSADDLRSLTVGAGFRRVELKPFSLTARFPNPDAFIAGEIEVDTAAIPSMQHSGLAKSGSNRRNHNRRYAITSQRGNTRQPCGATVPRVHCESIAVICESRI